MAQTETYTFAHKFGHACSALDRELKINKDPGRVAGAFVKHRVQSASEHL